MLELVEELKEGETIFLVLDTYKDFIYGEYYVKSNEFRGIKINHAELILKEVHKKERYFRDIISVDGFSIKFKHTTSKFLIYNDIKDALKDFCKKLKKNPEMNVKLEKKFRQKYPNYFY